jgi:hypothetical protein
LEPFKFNYLNPILINLHHIVEALWYG